MNRDGFKVEGMKEKKSHTVKYIVMAELHLMTCNLYAALMS